MRPWREVRLDESHKDWTFTQETAIHVPCEVCEVNVTNLDQLHYKLNTYVLNLEDEDKDLVHLTLVSCSSHVLGLSGNQSVLLFK